MRVDLMEADGYNFLVKSIDELIHLFHSTETTIDKNSLLINTFSKASSDLFTTLEPLVEEAIEEEENDTTEEVPSVSTNYFKALPQQTLFSNSEEGEIEFGTDLNSGKTVFWEPNNTNKVMHTNTGIIGTMGTGKTQFTKSLITQLNANSNKNIGDEKLGILIFDYKGDYIKEDFVTKTNATVLNPFHLPYNPLALDAAENSKPMLPLHTANDLKETISNAFNLLQKHG
jgi:DNA phosphorothioation-dependent restriction protein DptH